MAITQAAPISSVLVPDSKRLGEADSWNRFSAAYQDSMGQCTAQAAAQLVSQLDELLPIDPASARILDNGTGGGSIVRALKAAHPTAPILATDISQGMLAVLDAAGLPGVTTRVADAVTLDGVESDAFTHVATSFMIQFATDPAATLAAMHRVLHPKGVALVAIWGPRLDIVNVHERAAKIVLPSFKLMDFFVDGAWVDEDTHRDRMVAAGFKDVRVQTLNFRFPSDSAAAYTRYWLEAGNPVQDRLMADFRRQGGDIDAYRKELERVVREEYDDAAALVQTAVVGSGWK